MVRCHFIIIIYIYYSINEGFLQEMGALRRGPKGVRVDGAFGPVGS